MISIGIPTYSGATNGEQDILGLCLRAICVRTCSEIPYEIVVVDDSGDLEHQKKSRTLCEKFGARWLTHESNRGVAAGWNTLTREARFEHVALLNDDFYVSRGWLDALVYAIKENPHAGSFGLHAFYCSVADVSGLLESPDATTVPRHHWTKHPMPEEALAHNGREHPGRCMAPPGCGFGFSKHMYKTAGGFDESLGKYFYEESDFGTSLASHGFPTYALQWPHCYTIMSATFGRHPEITRGRDIFAGPRARYTEKWQGHTEVAHARFMSKIPFQRIKWLDPDGPREEIIRDEWGFEP